MLLRTLSLERSLFMAWMAIPSVSSKPHTEDTRARMAFRSLILSPLHGFPVLWIYI